jgi:putative SOS response-associated peptidase YedK
MPVILPPKAYDLWLSPDEVPSDQVLRLLKPFPTSQMKAIEVSTLVNNPAFDSPECIVPA